MWNTLAAVDLLDQYPPPLTARNNPEKGIQKASWNELLKELNEKHNRQFFFARNDTFSALIAVYRLLTSFVSILEQYKTKTIRLMQSYDLHKSITSSSGSGICPDKSLLDDDV